MAKNEILSAVKSLVEPVLESMDKELVHIEFFQEQGRWILRLYVDRESATGITVEELIEANREIGTLLEVEDVISSSYSLEVSSPGLKRPLGKLSDCDRFAGKAVRVKTREKINGRRNFRGVLQGSNGGSIVIAGEDENVYTIPWDDVKKANVDLGLIDGEKQDA